MSYKLAACAAALALSFTTAPALARDIPAAGLTFDEIVAWLQTSGYKAEVQFEGGKRNIYSSSDGRNFHISQYDCKNDVCGSLQFWVGFNTQGSFSAQQINLWNRKNRWVRAYVDDVNDPWLEMDVDLTPGGTYENLNDEFLIWREALARFHNQNQLGQK